MTEQVRAATEQADPYLWLEAIARDFTAAEKVMVQDLLGRVLVSYAGRSTAEGEDLLNHCRGAAAIVADLRLGAVAVAAALASAVPRADPAGFTALASTPLREVFDLVQGVSRMEAIPVLRERGAPDANDRAEQLEALRRMFLAMVQDLRVVLVKLADQTQRLRFLAARGHSSAQAVAARETFDLFAPLANRLGVWQLKWELEDLAFRCSQPEEYRRVARGLDEKRGDREAFIATVGSTLREQLGREGIQAEVYGRPKHIYSIYRKLLRKDLELRQLDDVRALRILVGDLRECYTALGLVHSLWVPLPGAFDDYIAQPKPNRYRSLHTAVVGPEEKVLEVQIRTREMHQECEYGVAAHWRYKEGARAAPGDERIAWLRRLLEWREDVSAVGDIAEHFKAELREQSIYVLTPQGRVINLPAGATPVDFAYHVHSDLGHRCRGARVDGAIVPLNQALANGQAVEIIAAKSGGPSLDWLNPDQAIVHSARARAKIRQWFNTQNLAASLAQGRHLVERTLARSGMSSIGLDTLAQRLGLHGVDELLAAVARAEIGARQLEMAARGEAPASARSAPLPPVLRPVPARPGASGVLVVGVDQLLTTLAGCCKPVPSDEILGFVSRGRGVTVHRSNCSNLRYLDAQRVVPVQWGSAASAARADLEVEAGEEADVMREILDLLSRERVRIASAAARAGAGGGRLSFTVEVDDAARLGRLIGLIAALPGVERAWRREH